MLSNKYRIPITILLILIGVCSCHRSEKRIIAEAELLMDKQPDSALRLLKTIEQPEKLPERLYSHYIVRLTQAKDKAFKIHTSDSLIQKAIVYYEKQRKDSLLWADAYRYCGRINEDLGKTYTAILYYIKAVETAPKKGYETELGLLNIYIGNFWYDHNSKDIAEKYYKKALTVVTPNDPYYYEALYCMSNIYADKKNIVKQKELLLKIKNEVSSYSELILYTYGSLISVSIINECYDDAERYLKEIGKLAPDTVYSKMFAFDQARLSARKGNVREAISFLNRSAKPKNVSDSINWIIHKGEIAIAKGDKKEELECYKVWIDLINSKQAQETRKYISETESRFRNERILLENQIIRSLNREKSLLVTLIIVSILLATVCLLFIYRYFRKRKSALLDEKRYYENLSTFLDRSNNRLLEEIKQSKKEFSHIEDLLKKNEIDSLMLSSVIHQSKKTYAKNQYVNMKSDKRTFIMEIKVLWSKEPERLILFIYTHYRYLVSGLYRYNPQSSPEDVAFLWLNKIFSSDEDIMEVCSYSKDAYRKRRSRFQEKFGLRPQEYLQIRE